MQPFLTDPDEYFKSRIAAAVDLEQLTEALKALLSSGVAVWEDGGLLEIKKLVATVDGLRIEIFHNEHPPPHFHVTGPGLSATFAIVNCCVGRSGEENAT